MPQRDVPEYFAFHPYDFLSDERVLSMSLEQVGAYLLLICAQWVNESIPSDIPALARMLKQTPEQMAALWSGISACYTAHPDLPGRMVQKRVEAERANALNAIEESREKQRAYRERMKALRNGNVTPKKGYVTEPSTLLSSYTSTKEATKKRAAEGESDALWGEFRKLYPKHRMDSEPAFRAWLSREAEIKGILVGLAKAVASDEWKRDGGKYVPKASNFISTGMYLDALGLTTAISAAPKPWVKDW